MPDNLGSLLQGQERRRRHRPRQQRPCFRVEPRAITRSEFPPS
jgi:hypothetical protein